MMKKLAIPLSLAAVAVLAGCASRPVPVAVSTAPAVMVVPANAAYIYPNGYIQASGRPYLLRSGFGRVESVVPVYYTTGVATGNQRIWLKMDDGSVQFIDTTGPTIEVGGWVQITQERYITYPVAGR